MNVLDMKVWLEERFPVSEDFYNIVFSPLTSGWHSTQGFVDDGFKMRVMYLQSVSNEPVDQSYNSARIIFTEIDHSHVDTVAQDYLGQLNSNEAFGGRFWFATEDGTYNNGFRVFAEYMTWAVFELWARETYPNESHEQISEEVGSRMVEQRKFVHYVEFRDALINIYAAQIPPSQT